MLTATIRRPNIAQIEATWSEVLTFPYHALAPRWGSHLALILHFFVTAPASPDMAHPKIETDANQNIQYLGSILSSEKKPLALRFRALFSLKHVASEKPDTPDTIHVIRAIAAAFSTPSDLLKHELAYCLGQTANASAAPFLLQRLQDPEESAICRHEAAEGLAALGHTDSLDLLRKLSNDQSEERVVRETCEIAVSRLEWQLSPDTEHERLRQRYSKSF